MNFRACLLYTFLICILFTQAACENNLRDVEEISSKKKSVPVDKSTGVEIIYSDSAVVQAKLITPELLHFKTDKPYYEMKKGVIIIFYDKAMQESSRVKSDYAIRRENEKQVDLRDNVVVNNKKGETFKSDELIWNENTKRFTSSKVVSVSMEGNTFYGTSFWANQDFSYYEMDQATGNFNLTNKQGF
ncbi:MAG: LPS export ABC transporter periplasmic protein LptC [Flavobacterium sp.]|nr:LPS export ABC transporter periplasmic protein LptC [Pedobacter sp.]